MWDQNWRVSKMVGINIWEESRFDLQGGPRSQLLGFNNSICNDFFAWWAHRSLGRLAFFNPQNPQPDESPVDLQPLAFSSCPGGWGVVFHETFETATSCSHLLGLLTCLVKNDFTCPRAHTLRITYRYFLEWLHWNRLRMFKVYWMFPKIVAPPNHPL